MTKIEWTDETWNPVTGCTKVSAGCKNCYAEGVADRFWGDRKFTDVRAHADRLEAPMRWRKPRRVFVNSMSDLFHEDVPDEFIDQVFAVMALCPHHTFQVLTKRPERMRRYMAQEVVGKSNGFSYGDRIARVACDVLQVVPDRLGNEVARRTGPLSCLWPLPNVWLGVSCEDQRAADERIPLLLQTPAAVRFVSAEPLLGPIDFKATPQPDCDRKAIINWVIVGGESGSGARPCDVAWIRSIVAQCKAAEVACFVKQLGASPHWNGITTPEHPAFPSRARKQDVGGEFFVRLTSNKGGDPSEWPADLRVREFPEPKAAP